MKRQSATPTTRPLRASGDRWLFGYADVVTLLFACFASLYASKVTFVKTAIASTPLGAPARNDAKATPAAAPEAPAPPTTAASTPVAASRTSVELALQHVLDDHPATTPLEVTSSARGLVLSLAEAGSFSPGRADLTADAKQVMWVMADAMRRLPNAIRVEGHTDNVPIHGPLFASNWELSTARATRVVQFLIEECGFDPGRLSAAGYAEYRPRVPNDTPESRARNRRVDLVFLDAGAIGQEPLLSTP